MLVSEKFLRDLLAQKVALYSPYEYVQSIAAELLALRAQYQRIRDAAAAVCHYTSYVPQDPNYAHVPWEHLHALGRLVEPEEEVPDHAPE